MLRLNLANMHLRRLESVGFLLQWVLVGAAVWNILQAGRARHHMASPPLDARTPDVSPSNEPEQPVSEAQLAAMWERNLRQTLIKPKPKKAPEPKRPPPAPPVKLPKLFATFVEQGKSWGLFVDSKGMHRVRAESQRVGGFQIVRIRPGSAQLKRGGTIYDVEVPRHKAPSGPRRQRKTKRR